jgi:flagellar FliL protein
VPDSEITLTQGNGSPAAGKSRKGALIALLLLLLAGGTVWGCRRLGAEDGKASSEASSRIKSVLHLETFVINLDDPGQRSYLRIGIDLGLSKAPKAKEGADGLPIARLRDTILSVLSVGRPEELLTPAGKAKLKADLLKALRQQAPQLGIEEVYFTEFLIQR